MLRALIVVIALLWTVQSQAASVFPCTSKITIFGTQEHPDPRIRRIFMEVLEKANPPLRSFALCLTAWFSPGMFPAVGKEGYGFAVLMPPYTAEFSDEELRGVFGHEFGHIGQAMIAGVDFALEVEADKHAAQWVGTNAVVAMLHALERHINEFPVEHHPLIRFQIRYRLLAITGQQFDSIE